MKQQSSDVSSLTPIIAGPILRAVSAQQVTIWTVTTSSAPFSIAITDNSNTSVIVSNDKNVVTQTVKVGTHAYVNVTTITPDTPLIENHRYYYDITFNQGSAEKQCLKDMMKDIVYADQSSPSFVFRRQLSNIMHGSCRKPHHESADGLLAVDSAIERGFSEPEQQPDMLIMSGDQVYLDDVAGPTLVAIHQVIDTLGLFHTSLPVDELQDSKQLLQNDHCYYQRPQLLPDDEVNKTVIANFFGGKKKPIFTSVNANNHLITFAEVIAMYVLVWSPEMWEGIEYSNSQISEDFKPTFEKELVEVKQFVSGLGKVRRTLAHLPVYMIFDDHDVTDDWNLTRGWEDAVYNHPFARRIIGNALIGYWLCQGWANDTTKLAPLVETLLPHFSDSGLVDHDILINNLLDWDQWHYSLDTVPKVVVLDTRTQRWRSESSLSKPSGLMDWEALCELQQELINQPSIIMVSAAPVFGVKLIETVQRIFTFFGKALMVDAENWMAHKGTASVMLNIFRHYKTPPNFVILSGDVHYSFVYDIRLKFRRNSPHITQITSSGIKNEFPEKLLRWFDRLNRIFYGPKSPLNWFTKRRNMTIRHRKPGDQRVRTLFNGSGIGKLVVDKDCEKVEASLLRANGEEILFSKRD